MKLAKFIDENDEMNIHHRCFTFQKRFAILLIFNKIIFEENILSVHWTRFSVQFILDRKLHLSTLACRQKKLFF